MKFVMSYSNKGFTMAEVLLTLVIIGVVAVLVMPSLIQRYQEKITITKVKKAYSLLNQAYQMAVIDHGTYDQWGFLDPSYDEEGNVTDEFKNSYASVWDVLEPYLKVVSRCNFKKDKCPDMFGEKYEIYTLSNQLKASVSNSVEAGLLLSDGILLTGGSTGSKDCNADWGNSNILKSVCADFSVKIGPKKSAYRIGQNAFYFYITKNGIYPIGTPEDTHLPFASYCNMNSNKSSNGYACSSWVIVNGNMDYLHCNDLSWDGKKRCSDR